jgi:hypothetical protein
VFRRLAVFPGPFTLEAAEAVAGPGTGAVVLALVDCSLVTPPQPGPDQRTRYSLLQTLRDYGRALRAEAGEETLAMAALAAFALPVVKQAAAGLDTSDDRELAALHWLDAEEATMAAALDWTLDHDPETALQLGVALAPWWITRGRATAGYTRLAAAAARVQADDHYGAAAQLRLGQLAQSLGNHTDSLARYSAAWETASDPLSRTAILGLAGRSLAQNNVGHTAPAADDARHALALDRGRPRSTGATVPEAAGERAHRPRRVRRGPAGVRGRPGLVPRRGRPVGPRFTAGDERFLRGPGRKDRADGGLPARDG